MSSLAIPPQSGARVLLSAGQQLRIVDVEGGQVADLFAVCADDLAEHASASTTRGVNRAIFPPVGGVLLSASYRPMLTFVRDDSPGFHDAQFAACSPSMYVALSFEGYHPSCAENFLNAAAAIGWNAPWIPDPFNFFQRVSIGDDEGLSTFPADTAPGDSVTLRAECDVHVIVTACSMDLANINGAKCTGLRLEIS